MTVAPSVRGVPAQNREFDDGFTVGAHDRGFLNDILTPFLKNVANTAWVFPNLTLTRLEKLFKVCARR